MKKGIVYIILILILCSCVSNQIITMEYNTEQIISSNFEPKAMGTKGIWAQNITGLTTISVDSDLSEWATIANLTLDDTTIWLAFDENNVYIACEWEDTQYNNEINLWKKYGMYNSTHANWNLIGGNDDVLCIGFDQNGFQDLAFWTASNRTENNLMYECDINGQPDNGTLPFLMNTNNNYTFADSRPIYDNYTNPLPADADIPNYTAYHAWFDSQLIPDDSQNDIEIAIDWNNSKENTYSAEIVRALNTLEEDDICLNFSEPLTLLFGTKDQDYYLNFDIFVEEFIVSTENEASFLTWDDIIDDDELVAGIQKYNQFSLSGTLYDDYLNYEVLVSLSGWEEWFVGTEPLFCEAYVSPSTSSWYFTFRYDEYDMPIGESDITVIFKPQYEDPLVLTRTIFVDDVEAPEILGVVDINDRYPEGIPEEEATVTITAGIDDNYFASENVTAKLFYQEGDNPIMSVDMTQFTIGSATFSGTFTLNRDLTNYLNYSYYIQAIDPLLNKAVSNTFTFTVQPGEPGPSTTTTKRTKFISIDYFSIIMGFPLTVLLIGYFRKKKKISKS